MDSAVILLSGGLDSLVSMAFVKERCNKILALTFNYGQKSFLMEKKSAQNISKFYGAEHKIVELDWLNKISNSALNTQKKLPEINISDLDNINLAKETAKSVWVPNRNALFVNIAACYADALNFEYIVIGANKEEGMTFKDNTVDFINAAGNLLLNSTNNNVKIYAPLIDMTKNETVKEGLRLNVPFEYVYSCYESSEKNCGLCESCKRLKRALDLNNRKDITDKIFI